MADERSTVAHARVIHVREIGSTNEEALQLARTGERGPLWIRADLQNQGRGRMGRTWSSPPGNLYASLLLHAPAEMRFLPQLAHVAGVALVAAVRDVMGSAACPRLKWPNDLLFGSAKAAGILVEGTQGADGMPCCVVGWGVNCRYHPSELPYLATNLSAEAGHEIEASDLFSALRATMSRMLTLWDGGKGYAAIRELWLADAIPLGTPIKVRASEALDGTFNGIDSHGRLLLARSGQTHTIEAGDILLTE